MGYATLYAQTAKKRPSRMPQDETLEQGEGTSSLIGAKNIPQDKSETIFQELFNEAQEAKGGYEFMDVPFTTCFPTLSFF